jgi:putative intracellular protease/amidase
MIIAMLILSLVSTGPMELLETAGTKSATGAYMDTDPKVPKPAVKFETEYLAETHDPITPMAGARVLATKTFTEVASKQFDIILIPGGKLNFVPCTKRPRCQQMTENLGDNSRPGEPSKALTEFVEGQAPGARYVLSVCTGSWILAALGLLDGRRATTNKLLFNEIKVRSDMKAYSCLTPRP